MTRSTGNSKRSSSLRSAFAKATVDKPRRDPSLRQAQGGLSGRRGEPVRKRWVAKAPSPVVAVVAVAPVSASRWATGRDVVLALVMAVGLSTVFLSPLRFSHSVAPVATPEASERVLGESISVPLTVTVTIRNDGQVWRTSVTPTTGTLAEVLARSASDAGSSFEYLSRGSSIYLSRFLDLPDDAAGSWTVRVNGAAVTDLSQPVLEQGDEITVERQAI